MWLTARVTDYEDGSRIFNMKLPDGKGQCEVLKIETSADFGCIKFKEGHEHIEIMGKKSGAPWHHKEWGVCPDCKGLGVVGPLGDAGCDRCCRSGRVMYWDDGYIGEEKTRRHPKEAVIGPPPRPTCPGCSNGIEPHWKACPECGQKLQTATEPQRVEAFIP